MTSMTMASTTLQWRIFIPTARLTIRVCLPSFSFPSTTTVLYLEFASRVVTVNSNSVTTEDFVFPSADADIILDTTRDNRVTALDALRVINVIDRQSNAEGEAPQQRALTDVNGDGRTSAVDALMIINYLDRYSNAEGLEIALDDLRPLDDDDDEKADWTAAFDEALTQGLG